MIIIKKEGFEDEYLSHSEREMIYKDLKKLNQMKEDFVREVIFTKSKWYQRIYIRLALKYKWKIWFVNVIYRGSLSDVGVKINGVVYWNNGIIRKL